MRTPAIILCLIATDLIRIFYMPHALSAAVTLDALGPEQGSSRMAYVLAFVATLPASFVYVLVCVWFLRLVRRLRT
jgi:hypothetical protein